MYKQTVLPRWRGFNLTNLFYERTTKRLQSYEVIHNFGRYREEDFQMIGELGFNFVRLPIDYTLLLKEHNFYWLNEERFRAVDEAVRYGEKYGIHVCINLHRAPGYCCFDRHTGENQVSALKEDLSLWKDQEALDAFIFLWQAFATRYRGISSEHVSFNLVNEPSLVSSEDHARVMRATVAAIKEIDKERLIMLDGLDLGNVPMPELTDLENVAQCCRGYIPNGVTAYGSKWSIATAAAPPPVWPGGNSSTGVWSRERLASHYAAWAAMGEATNTGVMCGEFACDRFTPHGVALSWMEDLLQILTSHNIGFALWYLKGSMGIMESDRKDVEYEDYRGYRLDKKMLELLRRY